MTIVAALSIQQVPMVIGDLLISGPEASGRTVVVPIAGEVTNVFPTGSGWSITGLRQKVNIIAPNCALGWAGSQLAASQIVKELIAMAASTPLTTRRIADYFSTLDPAIDALGVSIVGWVADAAAHYRFWHNADNFEAEPIGDISVAGSGAEQFRSYAPIAARRLRAFERDLSSIETAVSATVLSAGLMSRRL